MDAKIAAQTEAYNVAVTRMNDAADAIEALPEDATVEDIDAAQAEFDAAEGEVKSFDSAIKRSEKIKTARETFAPLPVSEPEEIKQPATAKGSLKAEHTYAPDNRRVSFFRDQLAARNGDAEARERLLTNAREVQDMLALEERDMQNASTQGAEFLPPLYLGDLWVEPSMAGRPFADALPKLPLPPFGTSISIPHLSSGVAVAARADAGTVQETDGVTASITHDVNEIAGQVDIGRIAVMRSDPGLDVIVSRTLVRRYNTYLDTQCLAGTGTAPQHRGIRAVSGANAVSYTDASPTAAECVPTLYNGIQAVATNRIEEFADLVVMHPRRAAWLSSNLSSTFPLFQLGSFMQAAGSQASGFVDNFAGLKVVLDANIGTTYGAGTNEDEIYVVASNDLILQEGPLMSRVFEDVGSGSGLVRYQVFAHSAFLSKRYPKAISIISGTGLVSPSF
jgi:HK97 family phage major capsid protein